ncbi:hypothetical protein, partial [Mitsuokella multacida]|uniref:hypothetical protein n=1 Tax=Mitsuokella multacida TaxID=52226 RepID=UPI0024323D85
PEEPVMHIIYNTGKRHGSSIIMFIKIKNRTIFSTVVTKVRKSIFPLKEKYFFIRQDIFMVLFTPFCLERDFKTLNF